MNTFVSSLAVVVITALSSGCYTTRIGTALPEAEGPTHQARQWFALAGYVGLSDKAGRECHGKGVAHAESRLSATDILIQIGLSTAGAAAGIAFCDSDSEASTYAACVSGAASLVPFLLGSRTVRYRCAGSGRTARSAS